MARGGEAFRCSRLYQGGNHEGKVCPSLHARSGQGENHCVLREGTWLPCGEGVWPGRWLLDQHVYGERRVAVPPFQLELTWNRGRTEPYANGGDDTHIAFEVDDYGAFHRLHKEMGCIVFENHAMGLYFITDPAGQWIEIIPAKG